MPRLTLPLLALLLAALLAPLSASPPASGARPGVFLLGADISWIPEDEAAGAEYFSEGKKEDIFTLLKNAGFNAVRLRIFVDPSAPQGYSRRHPAEAWCGLEQTKRMALRAKAAGMALVLGFHYSDTWADPEHQEKPAAWSGLTLPQLADAVHDHTKNVLSALAAQGTPPAMVQIGNEITFGLLWPDGEIALTVPTGNPVTDARHMQTGHVGGYDQLATLLKAGIAATREVDPSITIMLHNHLGRKWEIVREWTDALLARGVEFDVIGFSCYQQQAEGDWEHTFNEFVKRYPRHGLLVAEYSGRKRYINDLAFNLPGRRGWGSFIWEPTRHQEAIFDRDGRNAGSGPRPHLLSQGLNQAEAPGVTPAQAGAPANPAPRKTAGGRYDANAFMTLYREMAADYSRGIPPK